MKKTILPAALSLMGFLAFFILKSSKSIYLDQQELRYLLAFSYVCLGLAFARWAAFFCFDILYFKRTRREAPGLLRVMFYLIVYAAIFVLICGLVLEYNVTGLLATSAVLSVVLGLALQDTLGNFFAGASLHVEQPFKIKDSIKFREYCGEVETVSWRTTTIRTNDNTSLKFPNGLLARDPIEIFSYNSLHRHSVSFSAPYSVSPQTVVNIVKKAASDIPDVSYEIEPTARITGFGDSSVNYEAHFWMKDYMKVAGTGAKLRERIWYAFYRDNISMPFPTRHILLDRIKPGCRGSGLNVDYGCVIEGIELFQPLSPTEKQALLAPDGIRVYAPGECMVRCGEAGTSMFIIGRGRAEVRVGSNGGCSTVAVLEAGSFFGEMSLFSGEPRSADVVAVEEAEVLEIRKESLHKLLHENVRLAELFSEKVSDRLADLKKHADNFRQEEIKEEQFRLLERIKKFFNLG